MNPDDNRPEASDGEEFHLGEKSMAKKYQKWCKESEEAEKRKNEKARLEYESQVLTLIAIIVFVVVLFFLLL